MDDFLGFGSLEFAIVEFPDGKFGVGIEATVGDQVFRMPMSIDVALDIAESLLGAAKLAKLRNIAGQN